MFSTDAYDPLGLRGLKFDSRDNICLITLWIRFLIESIRIPNPGKKKQSYGYTRIQQPKNLQNN
jgi:hypothetical protein